MAEDALISAHIGLPHESDGIVLVERVETLTGEFDTVRRRWETTRMYRVRQIERPEAGARLTEVVELVEDLCSKSLGSTGGRISVLLNVSACGRPPVDLLTARHLKPIPIVTTQADAVRRHRGTIHVPRQEMMSILSILMADRRLQAPREAPNAEALADQMREFRAKSKPKSALEPWHEEDTGELVMALMLAVWWGETRMSSLLKQPPPPRQAPEPEPPLTFDMAMKLLRRNRQDRARI